ncbi:MAG TPA: hypothetical protein VLN49_19445 [Gemmatimonadaceae bacterium]|nr:hypothetical protein [Gemmatimonadaceae bacterium]
MIVSRRLLRGTLVLPVAAAIACSSAVDVPPSVTILVTNSTCSPGPCTSLRVLAFPDDQHQPHTPGGLWSLDLGIVSTASACLTIPAGAEFNVTGPNGTTTFLWSTANGLALGSLSPSDPVLQATPSTGRFVPSSAAGWSITLPGSSTPTPSGACTS